MKNKSDEWQQNFEKHWLETFGESYVPKKMTEDEKKFLEAAYKRCWEYDPDEEEVDAKYDDEFNKWCDEECGK